MKILAISAITAGALIASGCRHDYNPTPPPYYCQPAGCGCAPACAPSCNPCAPGTPQYLQPTANIRTAPYTSAPATSTYATPVTPAPNTYPAPGTPYQVPNPNPSLPAQR